jgi:hypothetical protein
MPCSFPSGVSENEKGLPDEVNLNNNLDARCVPCPSFHLRIQLRIRCRVKNPLAGISFRALLIQVDDFAAAEGLTDIAPLLQTGALVAQAPHDFESIKMTEEDKVQLRKEVTHKWHQPRMLYLTIALCSIGSAVQGWDQTGSNGANISFPQVFGIAAAEGHPNYERDRWLVGLINAAPYIASALWCVCQDISFRNLMYRSLAVAGFLTH